MSLVLLMCHMCYINSVSWWVHVSKIIVTIDEKNSYNIRICFSSVYHLHVFLPSTVLLYKVFLWTSIATQQCVVTISPVPCFFVVIFWRKWKLNIFGKLRVLWIWKPMLAFFSIQGGRQKSKMAAKGGLKKMPTLIFRFSRL